MAQLQCFETINIVFKLSTVAVTERCGWQGCQLIPNNQYPVWSWIFSNTLIIVEDQFLTEFLIGCGSHARESTV